MASSFKRHDTLRLFTRIARHPSLSSAANQLNMTKGAVSYQIKVLEDELGFPIFERQARGIQLTPKGMDLLGSCRPFYQQLEQMISSLQDQHDQFLTVGMSSYFASRWLSPRLMTFMQDHQNIRLRIQPMTELFDLEKQGIDIAIRWGSGNWHDDVTILPFMPLPAWPVGNRAAFEKVQNDGLQGAFSEFTLLRDHDQSTAWSDWAASAGIKHDVRRDTLIIPDPNVRAQAVMDGQGIALMDDLIADECRNGRLVRLSPAELSDYGYFLAVPPENEAVEAVTEFARWLFSTTGA